jgi:hypothetical protein
MVVHPPGTVIAVVDPMANTMARSPGSVPAGRETLLPVPELEADPTKLVIGANLYGLIR